MALKISWPRNSETFQTYSNIVRTTMSVTLAPKYNEAAS